MRVYCLIVIVMNSADADVFSRLGLAVGGLWGLREGSKRPIAASNARLRVNAILNSVTRRGTFIGNSAGVLGT